MLADYDVTIANKFIYRLSKLFIEDATIFFDVGKNQLWSAQSVYIKDGTRTFLSGGFGSMGFSLPASIGAAFETNKPVYSINGDGGIQMNIQELQTIATNKLNIKIIIINNHSLANVMIFQDRWLNSRYVGTSENIGDYHAAEICKIGEAYGLNSYKLKGLEDIKKVEGVLKDSNPCIIEFAVSEKTPVLPDIAADKDALRYDQRIPISVIKEIETLI